MFCAVCSHKATVCKKVIVGNCEVLFLLCDQHKSYNDYELLNLK